MKLIDKDALFAEIESRLREIKCITALKDGDFEEGYLVGKESAYKVILSFLDTLEVKETDLNEEIEKCLKRHSMLTVGKKDFTDIAKHFFELGLKTQHSSINIPNIDDIFEEEGIDPNSKDAKIFKECYYMALEKLKAQKGGGV